MRCKHLRKKAERDAGVEYWCERRGTAYCKETVYPYAITQEYCPCFKASTIRIYGITEVGGTETTQQHVA